MRTLASVALGAVGLLSPSAHAQVVPHERALPKALTGALSGGAAQFEPVLSGTRVDQHWYRGDNLPAGFVMLESGERNSSTRDSAASSYRQTVVLDNTTIGFSQLNTDPTKNLSAQAVTVFDQVLNFPALQKSTDPNLPHMWMKHSRPWVFLGPNLIFQRTRVPSTANEGNRYVDGWNMTTTTSWHGSAGKSCGGTLSAAQSATHYTLSLTGAPANAVGLYMISGEHVKLGPIRLPIDLSALGMTGCELGVVPDVLVPLVADASGGATLAVPNPIPANTLTLAVQALHSVNNPAGLGTTNVVTSAIGNAGLTNNVRVDKRGTLGPHTTNRCLLVVLIRGV